MWNLSFEYLCRTLIFYLHDGWYLHSFEEFHQFSEILIIVDLKI